MRGALRKISRKILDDDLFASFRGLYWSIKLRLAEYEPETQGLRPLVSQSGLGTVSAPELNTAEAYPTSGEAGPAVEMTTVGS